MSENALVWKAAIALSHFGKEALGPHVRISRSGHVIVVWVSFEVTIVIESTEREETAPLAVTKSGDGSGTVTSEPAGIECGSSCAARFVEGSEVTLKAEPAAGSRFAGWSGDCAGTGVCSLEIGEAQAGRGRSRRFSCRVTGAFEVKQGQLDFTMMCRGTV